MVDRTLEAGVLVAVLAIPLLFNPYSARVFAGEKAALLRALMAIAVVAGLVRSLETEHSARRWSPASLRAQPALVAALLIGLVTVLAGLVSITPRLSLWGSYHRVQGIVTTLGYLILFWVTISTFSDAGRRQRLVTTLLVASGPVALTAILQAGGLNPVALRSIDPSRVFGTLSNPIFLGAYLTLVFPLTLAQVARCILTTDEVRWGGATAYGLLATLQLLAAGLSGSRGPLVGLLAGGLLFLFLLALQSDWRRVAIGVLLLVVLGFLFLLVLNLPHGPLAASQDVPVLGRFAGLMDSGSARVRVLIWQGVVERFAAEPSRLLLGFGPESTHATLLSSYQPELRHLEPERLPDRAHNVFMEALVTTGLPGALSVAFLFGAVLYTGLRSLGWLPDARSRNLWLGLTVAGLGLGGLIPRLLDGRWIFSGVGAGFGLVAGLGIYLVSRLWQAERRAIVVTGRTILVAGILAALVGHLIEITVGIRVTVTQVVFWVLAGLLVVLSTAEEEPRAPRARSSPAMADGVTLVWNSEVAALGLLGGLMLSTLAFSVFLLPGAGASASAVGRVALLIGAWVLAGALWLAAPDRDFRAGAAWLYPALSVVWAGIFLVLRSLVPVLGGDALTLLNLYFVWVLLSLAGIVVLLPRPKPRENIARGWGAFVYPVVGVVALVVVAWFAVRPLRADVYLEAADAYAANGQWSEALAFYQQAAGQNPDMDVYQQRLGEAYATAARLVQDPNQRENFFQTADRAMQRAIELNPAEGTHVFNLAHLYLLWGQSVADPGRQGGLLDQAARLYDQAAEKMAQDPRVLTEWGQVLQAQGDADAALAKYREALELDPQDAQTYLQLGLVYQRSGKTEQAVEMYQQAIDLAPERAEPYRALADLYRQTGRLMDALTAQQRAAELRPTDYTIHQNLALLYRDLGQIQQAVEQAQLALNYAPPEQQAALQSFIQSLLASQSP